MGKQVSQYDKIFKENLEAIIPGLMENILGIKAVSSEELPDDIQHTKERKPDVLKKITDEQGKVYVLQIEFQVADEPDMVYRMAEYYIMLERKYKLPVRQFVIFLGAITPQMPVQLDRTNLKFNFPLIALSTLNYRLFLRSVRPEEVVLSILANFDGDSTDTALRQIISRVEETSKGDFSLRKYVNQLRVLAQLRKLDVKLEIAMDSIAQFMSEERDVFYLRGKRKAEERFVQRLLAKMGMTVEEIADMVGVSVDFVEDVKRKLNDSQ